MSNRPVNWERIEKALSHTAGTLGKTKAEAEMVAGKLRQLSVHCGANSHTRKMLERIGFCLLANERVTIVAPTCPDYTHENGRYTFCSLLGGVSLLAQKHITFLKQVIEPLASVNVHLLMADHEADDAELCRAVGKSRSEFLQLVHESVQATQDVVGPLGWKTSCMTELIPNLVSQEHEAALWIADKFKTRITTEAIQRSALYWSINRSFTSEEMRVRTINTAAQYVTFGRWACHNGYLICNHNTTNLSWYLQTNAGILHNPVSVY